MSAEATLSSTDRPPLARTPLFDLHVAAGARMVGFAGYEMPVQYEHGVLHEHNHTRTQAGLFDVSHMGQARLSPIGRWCCLAYGKTGARRHIDIGRGAHPLHC